MIRFQNSHRDEDDGDEEEDDKLNVLVEKNDIMDVFGMVHVIDR